MKKITVKRLLYRDIASSEIFYGGEVYDKHLTTYNILGSIFTAGRHQWCSTGRSIFQFDRNGEMQYQIYVGTFVQYQKSWYNLLSDNIKRILRI